VVEELEVVEVVEVDETLGVDVGVQGEVLRGRGLRFVLVDELMAKTSMTVTEMVATLARQGYDLGGRASKVISDALRWEVRRGRVIRLGRGLYRYGAAPASTARRIRLLGARSRTWIAARRASNQTAEPATRPWSARPATEHRSTPDRAPSATVAPSRTGEAERPPWSNLNWLWNA
jgi:hypothetical protein